LKFFCFCCSSTVVNNVSLNCPSCSFGSLSGFERSSGPGRGGNTRFECQSAIYTTNGKTAELAGTVGGDALRLITFGRGNFAFFFFPNCDASNIRPIHTFFESFGGGVLKTNNGAPRFGSRRFDRRTDRRSEPAAEVVVQSYYCPYFMQDFVQSEMSA
ncbi:unnamed protein product, partial [Ixodes pacificus]